MHCSSKPLLRQEHPKTPHSACGFPKYPILKQSPIAEIMP
jgi:hypothetical protein